MSTPSATLTVWAAAWLAGRDAPDDLLGALYAWAPRQFVVAADAATAERIGITTPVARGADMSILLRALRTAATELGVAGSEHFRLLLPVPGDLRGVPAENPFAAEVVTAGEGVLVGAPATSGIGLIPQWIEDGTLNWVVHSTTMPVATGLELTLGEAEYSMREAVRDAADAMTQLRVIGVGGADDPRALVEAELAAYARHQYPRSTPLRARRVLHTADHVASILTVAQREPSYAPASATGARTQEDLLRPLWDAIRSARLVAVRAAVQGVA